MGGSRLTGDGALAERLAKRSAWLLPAPFHSREAYLAADGKVSRSVGLGRKQLEAELMTSATEFDINSFVIYCLPVNYLFVSSCALSGGLNC